MQRPQNNLLILLLACFLPFSHAVAFDTGAENSRRNCDKMKELEEIAKDLTLKPKEPRKVSAQKAPIVIAYRDEGKEHGKAPFYDHYTAQKATGYPTRIACQEEMDLYGIISYLETTVHELPIDQKNSPKVIPYSFEGGLLLIPGRTRKNEYDRVRTAHETRLIKEALKRGQPILAICAGCWQLWKACGGSTGEVMGHSDRRGMMRIGAEGEIVYNIQVHRIAVEPGSLLAQAMGVKSHKNLSVNSVHWKAPNEKTLPDFLRIGARAVADDALAPQNTRGNGEKMPIQSGIVEAFESLHGAPLLGIQWHPEAYNAKDTAERTPEKHLNLLKFMADAGATYKKRREMLKKKEFKNALNARKFKCGENTTQ